MGQLQTSESGLWHAFIAGDLAAQIISLKDASMPDTLHVQADSIYLQQVTTARIGQSFHASYDTLLLAVAEPACTRMDSAKLQSLLLTAVSIKARCSRNAALKRWIPTVGVLLIPCKACTEVKASTSADILPHSAQARLDGPGRPFS